LYICLAVKSVPPPIRIRTDLSSAGDAAAMATINFVDGNGTPASSVTHGSQSYSSSAWSVNSSATTTYGSMINARKHDRVASHVDTETYKKSRKAVKDMFNTDLLNNLRNLKESIRLRECVAMNVCPPVISLRHHRVMTAEDHKVYDKCIKQSRIKYKIQAKALQKKYNTWYKEKRLPNGNEMKAYKEQRIMEGNTLQGELDELRGIIEHRAESNSRKYEEV
jgi:hypothetical protein